MGFTGDGEFIPPDGWRLAPTFWTGDLEALLALKDECKCQWDYWQTERERYPGGSDARKSATATKEFWRLAYIALKRQLAITTARGASNVKAEGE